MTITLGIWTHPTTRQVRLYVNGLQGQNPRHQKVWIKQHPLTPETAMVDSIYATPEQDTEARKWLIEECGNSWEIALKKAVGTPGPVPTPEIPRDVRSILENSLIVHLAPAARMAGLAFKNGLQKQEIIEKLLRNSDLAQRACDALEQLQRGQQPNSPPPAPDSPKPDWLDDDTPQPAPQAQKAESSSQVVDLSEYVKRPEWQDGNGRLAAATNAVRARVIEVEQASAAQGKAIKALQDAQPIVIQFPEKPEPIRIDGLVHPQFSDLLLSLRAGLHCMLVGPAGAGKTFSSEQAATALSRHFYMQGAITYAHELLGYIDAHSRYVRTQFRDAFEKGGLILLDEFDASAAEAALVLNAALANGACAFPDGLIRKHPDFLCVIGANTDGSGATMQYAGRARLDGAFLDRFVVFRWEIDARIETQMAQGNSLWLASVREIRDLAHKRGILDVVATPRATARGALLCAQGMNRERILERTCMRGALVECWQDVKRLPSVARFLRGE